MPDIFCGIDVGTQGARCVFARDDGRVAARAESPFAALTMDLAPGLSEQQPAAWMSAIRRATGEASDRLRPNLAPSDRLAAVGVTSTSGTLCVLDARHEPVVPAIMYNDPRSADQAAEVQRAGASVAGTLGYRFGPSFGLPKILWLRQVRPDIFDGAALFLSPTDYVVGWLTGSWGRSDETNMLKFGYDLLNGRWPAYIEKDLGIPLGRLPAVQKPGELAGRVIRQAAEETGLPAGLPVVAGMTDGCASQISSGAVAPGQYCSTIGTTLVIKGVSRKLLLDPEGRFYCHRHPQGFWLPGGASNTGARCLAEEFTPAETEERSARALDVSPTGLVSYPLVGRGERFPFRCADAEGFLLGEPASRDELFAAHMEGIACLERLAYETLEELGAQVGDAVFSAGGGARSDAWLQIRADTLGKTVLRPESTGGAMGAAILAASMERFPDLGQAARAMVRLDREVTPRARSRPAYDAKYRRFEAECRARGYLAGT